MLHCLFQKAPPPAYSFFPLCRRQSLPVPADRKRWCTAKDSFDFGCSLLLSDQHFSKICSSEFIISGTEGWTARRGYEEWTLKIYGIWDYPDVGEGETEPFLKQGAERQHLLLWDSALLGCCDTKPKLGRCKSAPFLDTVGQRTAPYLYRRCKTALWGCVIEAQGERDTHCGAAP